jgi:hypothetical protein
MVEGNIRSLIESRKEGGRGYLSLLNKLLAAGVALHVNLDKMPELERETFTA